MRMVVHILLCACLLSTLADFAAAEDKVQLKSGAVMRGSIVEESESVIKLRVGGEDGFVIDLDKATIFKIMRGRAMSFPNAKEEPTEAAQPRQAEPSTAPPAPAPQAEAVRAVPPPATEQPAADPIFPGAYPDVATFLRVHAEYGDWQIIEKAPVYIFHQYDAIRNKDLIDRIHTRAREMAEALYPSDPDALLRRPIIFIAPRSSNAYNQGNRGFKAAGVYEPARDVIMMNLAVREMWKTVRHEMTHLLFRRAVGTTAVPDSLNEGLAVYEETCGLGTGAPPRRSGGITTALTLANFLRMDIEEREDQEMIASAFYRLALATTQMLLDKKPLETYIAFSRDVARYRRLDDERWQEAIEELLKRHYEFRSLADAERLHRLWLQQ